MSHSMSKDRTCISHRKITFHKNINYFLFLFLNKKCPNIFNFSFHFVSIKASTLFSFWLDFIRNIRQNAIICQDRGHDNFLSMNQNTNFFINWSILKFFKRVTKSFHMMGLTSKYQYKFHICKNRADNIEATSNNMTYIFEENHKYSFFIFLHW